MNERPKSSIPAPLRAVAAALLALLVLVGTFGAPTSVQAQEPQPAPTEEPAPPPTSGEDSSAVDEDAVKAENRRLVAIVGGLIAVAVALLLMTIRYWQVTRPGPADPTEEDAYEDEPAGDEEMDTSPVPVKRLHGRRSRRAVAGADHAAADDDWEPRATGEHPAIDPGDSDPDAVTRVRPSGAARRRILAGD